MAKTAHGQIVDGGIIEGAFDWVLGTHFTFYGRKSQYTVWPCDLRSVLTKLDMNATGDPVGPDDLVAYPWAHPHDRIGRQFNGLISVAIHQRAEVVGSHKYCILTFTRDWCNGEPTTRTELDVSYDRKLQYNQISDADTAKTDPSSTLMIEERSTPPRWLQ
jgi:hypothetical protein